jgi:bifunctional ADP-heptose synthase (sugar kinase/adenylyltransferase)
MLICTITADRWVGKGEGRPLFPEYERLNMLRALRCVSQVIIIDSPGAETAIHTVKPQIYVKGKEYEGHLPEQRLVEKLGGKVVFLDTKPVYSSTRILNGEELRARVAGTLKT